MEDKKEEIRFQYESGEIPKPGVYTCLNCGEHTLIVPDMVKKLPKCKKCKGTIWMKV